MHPLLTPIADQIAAGRLKGAIAKLRQLVAIGDADLRDEVLVIASTYSKLRSDMRKGILAYADQQLQHAQLSNGLAGIISELEDMPEVLERYQQTVATVVSEQQSRQLDFPIPLREALFSRLAEIREKSREASLLWIDNHPTNNHQLVDVLKQVGLRVDLAERSSDAEALLNENDYDLVLSDISREGNRREGLHFLRQLRERGNDLPLVFYTGYHDRAVGVPPYAFGITHSPEELLHLVMDVLARGGKIARGLSQRGKIDSKQ